jgi:hypothetical protein
MQACRSIRSHGTARCHLGHGCRATRIVAVESAIAPLLSSQKEEDGDSSAATGAKPDGRQSFGRLTMFPMHKLLLMGASAMLIQHGMIIKSREVRTLV